MQPAAAYPDQRITYRYPSRWFRRPKRANGWAWVQLENAKAEVQKSFPQEEELKTKSARLNELNAMLDLDKRENEIVDGEQTDEEPSRSSDDRER